MYVEVRDHLWGVSFLLPPFEFHWLDSCRQTSWQATFTFWAFSLALFVCSFFFLFFPPVVLFIYNPSELELAIYIVRTYIGFLILRLPSTHAITLTWVLYWNWQCAGFPFMGFRIKLLKKHDCVVMVTWWRCWQANGIYPLSRWECKGTREDSIGIVKHPAQPLQLPALWVLLLEGRGSKVRSLRLTWIMYRIQNYPGYLTKLSP